MRHERQNCDLHPFLSESEGHRGAGLWQEQVAAAGADMLMPSGAVMRSFLSTISSFRLCAQGIVSASFRRLTPRCWGVHASGIDRAQLGHPIEKTRSM
ncbi:MAG: hypothetical protein ACLVJ6_17705 [Merdibacter sp.]